MTNQQSPHTQCRPNPRTDLPGPTLLSGLPRRTSRDACAASALPLRGCLLVTLLVEAFAVRPQRDTLDADAPAAVPPPSEVSEPFQKFLHLLSSGFRMEFGYSGRIVAFVSLLPTRSRPRWQVKGLISHRTRTRRKAESNRKPKRFAGVLPDHRNQGMRHVVPALRGVKGRVPVSRVGCFCGSLPSPPATRYLPVQLRVGIPPSHPVVLTMLPTAPREAFEGDVRKRALCGTRTHNTDCLRVVPLPDWAKRAELRTCGVAAQEVPPVHRCPHCAFGRIRTGDLLLRRETRYPLRHEGMPAGCAPGRTCEKERGPAMQLGHCSPGDAWAQF